MMEMMQIGKSGVMAPKMILGTFAIGGGTSWQDTTNDDRELLRFLQEAREYGIKGFDTAPVYGTGRSERLLSEVIGKDRDKLFLSTKCSLNWREEKGVFEYDRDGHRVFRCFEKDALIKDCEESLRRLKTDYIDCMIVHRCPAPDQAGEVMEALETLKDRGLIRCAGLSNVLESKDPGMVVETFLKYGRIDLLQEKANLLMRPKVELIRTICEKHDITFQCHSPLERGALAGKISPEMETWKNDNRTGSKWFRGHNIPLVLELIEGLKPIAERNNCSVPVLCIAWLKAQTPLMNLLVGARRMESLKDTMLALDVDLTAEDVNEMNALADRAAAGVK